MASHEPAAGSPGDRFRGLLVGAALGSIVSASCEGREARVLRDNRDNGLDILHQPGEDDTWSGDVEQCVIVMEAYHECGGGDALPSRVAHNLRSWVNKRTDSAESLKPGEIDGTTFKVTRAQDYLSNPIEAARKTIGAGGLGSAPMIRSLPLATLSADWLRPAVMNVVSITHSDERVVAAALFNTELLSYLVAGSDPTPNLVRRPMGNAIASISDPAHKRDFLKTLEHTRTLEDAELEFPDQSGHAVKTMRVVIWAYRQLLRTPKHRWGPELFRDCLTEIALCGRCAGEHCALGGAVLGAALGLTNLPPEWIKTLPNSGRLEGVARAYLEKM